MFPKSSIFRSFRPRKHDEWLKLPAQMNHPDDKRHLNPASNRHHHQLPRISQPTHPNRHRVHRTVLEHRHRRLCCYRRSSFYTRTLRSGWAAGPVVRQGILFNPTIPIRIKPIKRNCKPLYGIFKKRISTNFTPTNAVPIQTARQVEAGISFMATDIQ
jgi:hypothetical protein